MAEYADVDNAPLPTGISLTKPVAGVVGQFSPRIDLSLLEAVAGSGLSLLLVGPRLAGWGGDRFDSLVGRSNVAWVGQVPFDRLASYLRLIDVGLTPYADSPFNRASFPLKTLEYLAAGRAVISTPLPAVSELATDLIITAQDAREFAAAALRLAARPRRPEGRHSPAA